MKVNCHKAKNDIYTKGRNFMDDRIYISEDDIEILDISDYSDDVVGQFSSVPDIAKPLIDKAKFAFQKIENMLYTMPSFVNMIKSAVPQEVLQAVLTDEQKSEIAKGALKLMTKKDGSLMATLVNPKTNKIVSTIPLKSVKVAPELAHTITDYTSQMQMAQIAEQIQLVQIAIEEVRQGQEYDRLALAYSCQQKLLQAMTIKNPELKTMALLQVVSDAEDSRNMLMLSQGANIEFIKNQPEGSLEKLIRGANHKKIDARMNEIRESLCAVNMVSLAEAMVYQELGEPEAARQSLLHYANYIKKAYLSTPGLVNRLDSIDASTEKYWTKTLPNIQKKIRALPCYKTQLLEDETDGETM